MSWSRDQYLGFAVGATVAAVAILLVRPFSPPSILPAPPTDPRPAPAPLTTTPSAQDRLQLFSNVDESQSANQRALEMMKLDGIPIEDLPLACSECLELGESKYGPSMSALLIRWARGDGSAAMDWIFDNLESSSLRFAFSDVGRTFAWHEPFAFADWLIANPERRKLYERSASRDSGPVKWLLESNFKAALSYYEKKGKRLSAYSLRTLILTHAQSSADLQALLSTAAKLREESDAESAPASPARTEVRHAIDTAVAKRWREIDPSAYEQAIKRGDIRRLSVDNVRQVDRLQDTKDPRKEADQLLSESGPSERQDRLRQIVRTWAEADLDASGQWLGEQPDDQERWPAVEAFALQAVAIDPVSAFQWVDTITDPATRRKTELRVFEHWNETDPDGLTKSLEDPEWSDSKSRTLKELHAVAYQPGSPLMQN